MKLDDMLSISDKLEKGVEFEVFSEKEDGKRIVAYVTTIDKNEFSIELNREIYKYLSDHNLSNVLDIPTEDYIKLQYTVIIKSVIKDVKGIEDNEGNEKEWTKEFAFELLKNPRSKKFFNRIFNFADIITAKEYTLADNYTKKK